MIWIRSRLPEVGSFTAQTTNVGATPGPVPVIVGRSAPNRHAVGVGLMHPILRVENVLVKSPAAKESDFDMRSADAEGFLAIHRIPKRLTSVFLSPYTG